MFNSSIGRKLVMALSGVFLIVFLTQHLVINLTSLIPDDGKVFNFISHFMGNNPIVQFILQPILILGVVIHFIMGMYLEILNQRSRQVSYVVYSGKNGASWASRNMIISGLVILAFLVMHFYDFWVPEMIYKYVEFNPLDENRYFHELQEKFYSGGVVKILLYCASFILLGLHLSHGFSSSLQSMGIIRGPIKLAAKIFSISVPIGFIIIAIFHYITTTIIH
tara:strand:- start:235 stop:900 length:666 start_codon:yes stop_codon:yes gene_type:complete